MAECPTLTLFKTQTGPGLVTVTARTSCNIGIQVYRWTDMNWGSLALLLTTVMWLVQSHVILEEKQDRGRSVARLSDILPPISIVDLKKSSRRVSRVDAERNKLAKKKVIPIKKPRTPPPPNCVPLKSSCKPPAPPCCEPCAFCYCHFFKTVCIYWMGNPNC